MSLLEIKHDVEVPDFYCMLAKAMDYDELDSFRQFVMNGGKKGKFKWSSSDKAGTLPTFTGLTPSQALARGITGLLKGKSIKPGGRAVAERIAEGQHRSVAYICPDGITRDKNRNKITRSPEHIPYSFRAEGEFTEWLSAQYIQQK